MSFTRARITQNEIAKATGVTEVSVRNRYKDLKKVLDPHLKEDLKEQPDS